MPRSARVFGTHERDIVSLPSKLSDLSCFPKIAHPKGNLERALCDSLNTGGPSSVLEGLLGLFFGI